MQSIPAEKVIPGMLSFHSERVQLIATTVITLPEHESQQVFKRVM